MGRFRGRGDGIVGDTSWALVGNVVTLGCSLLSFVIVGNGLGPTGFGHYTALYSLSAPLGGFSFSGLLLGVMQHVVREREDARSVTSSALTWCLLLGGMAVVVGAVAAPFLLDGLAIPLVVGFLVAELVLVPLVLVSASAVQCVVGFRSATMLRAVPPVVRTSALATLALTGAVSVTSVVLATLVASMVTCVIGLWWASRMLPFEPRPADPKRSHLKTSVLFSSSAVANGFIIGGDKLVLSATGADRDLGLYGAAYRILSFAGIPLEAIVASSHLRFLDHDEHATGQHVRRARVYGLVAFAYGVVAVVAVFLGAPLLGFVLGDDFDEAQSMLRRLVPILLISGPASFALNGLLGLGKNVVRSIMLFFIAAYSMVVYGLCIVRWGVQGAIVATYIIEATMFAGAWTALIHYQRLHDADVRSAQALAAAP